MGSFVPDLPKLHRETPCIPSLELSRVAGCNIYLKLENLQPSGSFKSRGIGALMGRALGASGRGRVHFYCSSGGNAGLACAEAARTLGQPCDVFLWSMTPDNVLAKLASLGATPHRAGKGWPEADAFCRAAVAADPEGVYVPPFDHPSIWAGNSTVVDELAAIEAQGFFDREDGTAGAVDAIVCSVGGGGLVNGVMAGIERNYGSTTTTSRGRPAVLAVETLGADSLAASIRAGDHVTLPEVTSVATTLGAPRVSEQTYWWAQTCKAPTIALTNNSKQQPAIAAAVAAATAITTPETTRLVSAVVSDADAVSACVRFVDDARVLVEPACGATLASAYAGPTALRAAIAPHADDESWARTNVVLVVCGGSGISMDMLAGYRARFGV